MIKALNPEAWCFITTFDNIDPVSVLIDPFLKRVQETEKRRIHLIKELITNHCKDFSIIFQEKTPHNTANQFKVTDIIFFGGYIV